MIEALPKVFIDRLNGRCRYIFFLAIHCFGVQRQSKWQWFTNISIVILFKLTKTSTCGIHCLNFDFLFHMHLYISTNYKINVIYINTISGLLVRRTVKPNLSTSRFFFKKCIISPNGIRNSSHIRKSRYKKYNSTYKEDLGIRWVKSLFKDVLIIISKSRSIQCIFDITWICNH